MTQWEDDDLDMLGWLAMAVLGFVLAAVAAVIGIAAWALA